LTPAPLWIAATGHDATRSRSSGACSYQSVAGTYVAPAAVGRYQLHAPELSSKPAARRCCCRSMGQTDGRTSESIHSYCRPYLTDGRTPDRYTDPSSHTMRARAASIRLTVPGSLLLGKPVRTMMDMTWNDVLFSRKSEHGIVLGRYALLKYSFIAV